ncbi:MAG: amidohydrolase family protein, partial [Chitinivibrionales bacterium]|nr:amidohydrolase family protein [Chitinivibrionales bacterium]
RWVGTTTLEGGSEIFLRDGVHMNLNTDLVNIFIPPEKISDALNYGRLSFYPPFLWPVYMNAAAQRIGDAYRSGVKIRAGTDALMCNVFFGFSQHWELELLTLPAAGFTPLQALKIGTLENAEVVGASQHLGSLTPGKLADVVILNSNPLENIQNTITLWRVIKGGTVFDPKTIRPVQ